MRIGQILLKAHVIKPEELQRALVIQARSGGKLGPILVALDATTQEVIDRTWAAAVITPNLEAALDRATMNAFTRHADREITYTRIRRHDTITENMLSGATLMDSRIVVRGACTLRLGHARSLELEFELDPSNSFVLLDDRSEAIARRWVDLVHRGVAAGSESARAAEPGAAEPQPAAEAA